MFSEAFEGCDGTIIYMDDLLIWGSTMEELMQRLRQCLERARQLGIKFSKEKIGKVLTEVEYIGEVLSAKGISISPRRIEAIKALQPPTCKKELQSFLGMITYLTRFLKDLSSKTVYLRSLLSNNNVHWLWDEQAQRDFDTLKKMISEAPILAYFDPSKEITISVDASSHGIGAVLMQGSKAVAYASSSLNATQERYAPIEREFLAIIFGMEHFHYYAYGRHVQVQTDHKPLVAIVRKAYDKLSPRLQRMLLRLQKYDFSLVHVPGKDQYVSDYLSRNPEENKHIDSSYLEGKAGIVHMMVSATPSKLEELRKATTQDSTLRILSECLKKGWPRKITETPKEIHPFWSIRDELHEDNGLLFKAHRLIIPRSLQDDILCRIHSAHQGIVACRQTARESLFWIGMNQDILNKVQDCVYCQQYQPGNTQDLLTPHSVPDRPWEKVAIDLFKLNGKNYICAVDYFSKYIECQELQQTTSTPVITFLKSIFARHGVPDVLISDNGPPFNSGEMREFCRQWDTSHQTSSPNYPQSNGMIERAIQTMKGIFHKTLKAGDDPYKALLRYRATSHMGLPSPSSLLMGRQIRTDLPTSSRDLKPKFDVKDARSKLKNNQDKQKTYANKQRKKLIPLKKQQPVMYF